MSVYLSFILKLLTKRFFLHKTKYEKEINVCFHLLFDNRLLANAQHTVVGSYHRVIDTLQALFIGVNTPGYQLPKFSWERGSVIKDI